MQHPLVFRRLAVAGILGFLLVSSFAGCGSGKKTFKPKADAAKTALEKALATWKAGKKLEPIDSGKPVINVVDVRWQAGKHLVSYEILEEEVNQEHTQFKVRLKLSDQPEETTVYKIIGIDPLHIFREADYKKATGG